MQAASAAAGILLLLAALIWLAMVSPRAARLPGDYALQAYFVASTRARRSPTSEWEQFQLVGRRLDTTLMATGDRSIIQSDVYWALPDGRLYFENAGIYAVDRHDRTNLEGLGDRSRDGIFMFPPDTGSTSHRIWDSQFAGPRQARFSGFDALGGMRVQRYAFSVRNLDETVGYSHLADVPERFRALTDGDGSILVEPRSGMIVDYSERGRSYFADAQGRDLGGLFEWTARFTDASRQAQLERAARLRRQLVLEQYVIPALLAAVGLALLVAGARTPSGARP